jgi:hypothetical protein
MQLVAMSAQQIQESDLPGPAYVLRMADTAEQLAPIKDMANAVCVMDRIFNDASESYGPVRAPMTDDAWAINGFAESCEAPYFVAQCQAGVGRSQAVVAALRRMRGWDDFSIRGQGTYNIRLYRLMLEAAGISTTQPLCPLWPLVSIAVRVKYAPDRLHAFLLSMQRQRHENWEVVAVTDGPNYDAVHLVETFGDSRVRVIETETTQGRWGHPHRQMGIDCCHGEYIGLSNDDNYYVPGYLEQMLLAIEYGKADMAVCQTLHSYAGWNVTAPGGDLGCWIAKADVVKKTPWPSNEFDADREYIDRLARSCKAVSVDRPLFIHN